MARAAPSRVSPRPSRTRRGHPSPARAAVVPAGGGAAAAEAEGGTRLARTGAPRVAVFGAEAVAKAHVAPAILEAFPGSRVIDATASASTAALAEGCDVACAFVNDDLGGEALASLAQAGVKLVALRCAGYDRVDLAAADELGIKVARVPAYSPRSVAEHALSLVFTLNKSIHKAYNRVRDGNFCLAGLVGVEVGNQTMGVVGTGEIGKCFCRMALGIGCRVLASDLRPDPELAAEGVEYVTLDALLEGADVVSLHAPLNEHTRHLIGEEQIVRMKPGAVFVNTSRGGLVDSKALVKALETRRLGGLGMDVYENEARLFFRDWSMESFRRSGASGEWDETLALLMSFPNVIITPHSAFLTEEALANIAETTVANIREYGEGRDRLTNEVRL